MSTPNPLMPQGSLSQPKGKSNIKIAVFTILAIHAVLLVGLLLQGCKDKKTTIPVDPTASTESGTSNTLTNTEISGTSTLSTDTLTPAGTLAESNSAIPANHALTPVPPTAGLNNTGATAALPTPTPAPLPVSDPVITPSAEKEYVVASGDTLDKIAKQNGISVKALQGANPSVVPTKLKIGQKLQLPGATASVASTGTAAPAVDATSADSSVYVVKAGDVLERIAKNHGTNVKAIKTANNLRTDRLKVGQKLKLPAGKTSSATADVTPVASSNPLTPTPLSASTTMASAAR